MLRSGSIVTRAERELFTEWAEAGQEIAPQQVLRLLGMIATYEEATRDLLLPDQEVPASHGETPLPLITTAARIRLARRLAGAAPDSGELDERRP